MTCAGLAALGLAICCGLGVLGNLAQPDDPALPAELQPSLPVATETATLPAPATNTPSPTEAPTSSPTTIPPTAIPAPTLAPPDCECSFDAYNCDDPDAEICFRVCREAGAGDIHGLDGDGNGLACENN